METKQRELKFRAWLIDENEFLYSDEQGESDFNEVWQICPIDVEIQDEIWKERGGETVNEIVYVRPKQVVQQFTGLRDNRGLKIYEGDILREMAKDKWEEKNFNCFEVFFHDGDENSDYNIGYTMGRMHSQGSLCGGYILPFKPKQTHKMIIIGNIFHNPELLT